VRIDRNPLLYRCDPFLFRPSYFLTRTTNSAAPPFLGPFSPPPFCPRCEDCYEPPHSRQARLNSPSFSHFGACLPGKQCQSPPSRHSPTVSPSGLRGLLLFCSLRPLVLKKLTEHLPENARFVCDPLCVPRPCSNPLVSYPPNQILNFTLAPFFRLMANPPSLGVLPELPLGRITLADDAPFVSPRPACPSTKT